MAEARRAGHDPLGAHPRLGKAQVQRIVAERRQLAVHAHQVLHAADLAREDDAVVRQPARLGEGGGAHGAFRHRVHHHFLGVLAHRFGKERVGVHHLREQRLVQRAPVHPDAHRLAELDGALDDGPEVLVVALGAHVAGVDAVLGQRPCGVGILGQQLVAVVVKVAHDGHVHAAGVQELHDVRHRPRGLVVVHRNAHDLAAGAPQGGHLPHGALHVGRVGVGHGLHHHRVRAPHGNAAHVHGNGAPALYLLHLHVWSRVAVSPGI
jgi:hypothetical protein